MKKNSRLARVARIARVPFAILIAFVVLAALRFWSIDGELERLTLDEIRARVVPGMTRQQVERELGFPHRGGTSHWYYHNAWRATKKGTDFIPNEFRVDFSARGVVEAVLPDPP